MGILRSRRAAQAMTESLYQAVIESIISSIKYVEKEGHEES